MPVLHCPRLYTHRKRMHIRQTLGGLGGITGTGKRRHENPYQNRDDSNDDKHLYEGEGLLHMFLSIKRVIEQNTHFVRDVRLV